jgi:hypothetical protein
MESGIPINKLILDRLPIFTRGLEWIESATFFDDIVWFFGGLDLSHKKIERIRMDIWA